MKDITSTIIDINKYKIYL